jgi:hypothetical protein
MISPVNGVQSEDSNNRVAYPMVSQPAQFHPVRDTFRGSVGVSRPLHWWEHWWFGLSGKQASYQTSSSSNVGAWLFGLAALSVSIFVAHKVSVHVKDPSSPSSGESASRSSKSGKSSSGVAEKDLEEEEEASPGPGPGPGPTQHTSLPSSGIEPAKETIVQSFVTKMKGVNFTKLQSPKSNSGWGDFDALFPTITPVF